VWGPPNQNGGLGDIPQDFFFDFFLYENLRDNLIWTNFWFQ